MFFQISYPQNKRKRLCFKYGKVNLKKTHSRKENKIINCWFY